MDKQKIAAALSILAGTRQFVQRVKQIEEILDGWENTQLLFGGPLEPFNALVEVGLHNREAFGKLIDLARTKRRSLPDAKRVDYQRELMREKRERLDRAVRLEELVRGARLTGDKRAAYKKATQERWMNERNAFITGKGNLSWKERNEAANEFWSLVDQRLNKDIAEAQAVLDRPPVKRKRTVQVAQPKVTALSKAFAKAKKR